LSAQPNPVCFGQSLILSGSVSDPDDPPGNLTANYNWSMPGAGRSGSGSLTLGGDGSFSRDLGKFPIDFGPDQINITVTVTDNDSQSANRSTSVGYNTASCNPS
jgi:hypothetical protein